MVWELNQDKSNPGMAKNSWNHNGHMIFSSPLKIVVDLGHSRYQEKVFGKQNQIGEIKVS